MTEQDLEYWLNHAIQREIYARDYYQKAMSLVAGEAAKRTLERLVAEEEGHRTRLESIKKKKDWSNLGRGLKNPRADFARERAFVPIREGSTPREILSVAILNEENARLFYQWFVEVYAGTELEDFFSKLVAEEKRHAELLAELEKTLSPER